MGKLVYGYLDCEYCGTTGIRGDNRECPGCGRVRGEHTKFYMQKGKKEYVAAHKENRTPDWVCDFCDTLNSSKTNVCASCGSTRGSKPRTYFDVRAEEDKREAELRAQVSRTIDDNIDRQYDVEVVSRVRESRGNTHYAPASFEEDEPEPKAPEYVDNGNPFKDEPEERERLAKSQVEIPTFGDKVSEVAGNVGETLGNAGKAVGRFFAKCWMPMLIGLLITACIAGLVYLFIPKEHELTIKEMTWERSIAIEKYAWVDDSGWSLPSGARLKYTNEEVYTYTQVFSHYETKTRQVVVGYDTKVVGYRDLGNGQFEEITEQVPVYGTEEYQEAVYISVPVYETKYYYEIQRWIHGRYVKSSGTGLEPYWGEVILGEKERQGSSSETYTIVGVDEDGEQMTVTMSYNDYMKLEIGAVVKVKVTFGYAEIVFD